MGVDINELLDDSNKTSEKKVENQSFTNFKE